MMDQDTSTSQSGDLQGRIEALEKRIAKSEGSDWLRLFDVLSKFLIPLLIFVLAYMFKDSVQQALAYRQLEVDSAEAIEKLLITMHKPEIDNNEAMAAALTLSAYGEAAIMPLVSVYENGSPATETAAKHGLFIIGLSHPDAVTKDLDTVLKMRHGQFRWQTHEMAIEVLGEVGRPPDAVKTLCSYARYFSGEGGSLATWKEVVRDATEETYKRTQKTLASAFEELNTTERSSCM